VTAHPKIDPVTGEMVWFAYGVGPMPLSAGMSYGVTGADGTVLSRQDFEAPYAAMVHDFMVTQNHVLFPVLPLTASLERAMSGRPPFAWEPQKGSHVGVMRRDGDVSSIRWFNTEACYVFHPLNAWEEGDRLYADVMRYNVAPLFPKADGSPGDKAAARLVRWTFDLSGASDAIKEEPLDDLDGEFPRIDPRVETLKHRHGWYAADPGGKSGVRLNAIAHLDLQTGKRQVYELDGGDATSEPVFTPRSASADEGDGWLTAVIYRAGEDRSDFAVFDALDVAKGPIALAEVPRRVPFGFHGNWVAM
jgi:carotenoid cleavage dioxygenase